MDSSDQPNSMCHIKSIHMYPLGPKTSVPFELLTGETVQYSGSTVDGPLILTNYRLFLQARGTQYHIPKGMIETVEQKEMFQLHIGCKDARTYKIMIESDKYLEYYDILVSAAEPVVTFEQLFAFYHCIWSREKGGEEANARLDNQKHGFDKVTFENEMSRLQFQGHSWRISKVNENYKFCPSYPPYLIVPSCINDDMLEMVAKFRSSRRIPAVVWRHSRNGAVIVRSSQPEVGWLGWRSGEDEDLLKAISDACSFDSNVKINYDKESNLSHSPGSYQSDESLQITNQSPQGKKVLIMDARSYTMAIANRARGGGCECPEYYPNCEIEFMNLANIHSIRKSFHALRLLYSSSAEHPNWLSQLEGTRWLLHMSGVMKAAVTLVAAVERDGRPVLVHCSDGWDRTPQIVSLAELLLDPYYRTVEGFQILVEREWLAFGHKFADRCGNSLGSDDSNERCPVFLQWLDCVHQLLLQFPCAFEFSQTYLVKLVQHTYANLFGTFLCNTQKQRTKLVYGKTFSVWDFLKSPCFRNHLYATVTTSGEKVLWPQCNIKDLQLWTEVYLGSVESNFNLESKSDYQPKLPESSNLYMTKTRSYGDLINDGEVCVSSYRRSSDPSINSEPKLGMLSQKDPQSESVLKTSEMLPTSQPSCFPNDLEDSECNQDCIFKNISDNVDDQISKLEQIDFGEPPPPPPVAKAETLSNGVSAENGLAERDCDNGTVDECEKETSFSVENVIVSEINKISSDLDNMTSANSGDSLRISQNGDVRRILEKNDRRDSCDRLNGDSASDLEPFLGLERTVESSTDTIVAENVPGPDICERRTRCSSTNSANGWDNMYNLTQNKNFYIYQHPLGEDGLVTVRSVIQERLNQIMDEHQRKVELLEKELHIARQSLIKQTCHRCNQTEYERPDDNSSVGSQCSTGEGQASVAGESLRSDLSWVAIEEGALSDCQRTLWVPDHAVNKCTGCSTEFWLGRRRHHCRKCGRIFCADCSENSTPLPDEHLYNPVRVCTNCFSELRSDCGTDMDKHTNSQPINASPRIAASSN